MSVPTRRSTPGSRPSLVRDLRLKTHASRLYGCDTESLPASNVDGKLPPPAGLIWANRHRPQRPDPIIRTRETPDLPARARRTSPRKVAQSSNGFWSDCSPLCWADDRRRGPGRTCRGQRPRAGQARVSTHRSWRTRPVTPPRKRGRPVSQGERAYCTSPTVRAVGPRSRAGRGVREWTRRNAVICGGTGKIARKAAITASGPPAPELTGHFADESSISAWLAFFLICSISCRQLAFVV